jgi:uncharacterized delta-60 repeat protein
MTIKSLQSTSLTNNIFYRSMLAGNGASGLPSYWLATLGGTGSETAQSVGTDSLGNSYAFGFTNSVGAGSHDFLLAKYDPAGIVQWQRILGGSTFDVARGLTVDSSDNIYVIGQSASAGAGSNDFLIAKYNTSGTIQWQRTLGGTYGDDGQSVSTDSSGNLYIAGQDKSTTAGANYNYLVAKYNYLGTIQWQRSLGGTENEFASELSVDSSGNVYVVGSTLSDSLGGYDILLAKYNSAGTIQWQRVLGGTGGEQGFGVAFDSVDNVYICGYTTTQGSGSNDFLIAKYNPSGTIQWQKILGGTGQDTAKSIAFDSSDYFYVFGECQITSGPLNSLIAKYDSAGTIQWQRTLSSAATDVGISVTVDLSNNIYAIGTTSSAGAGSNDFLFAKLPNDGSLTGTYVLNGVNIVYAASSFTAATSSVSARTSSLTAATSTLTAATSTLTDASASLTSYLVEL